MTNTYTILEAKHEDASRKLRRCEKKAQKYGIPFSFSFGETYGIDITRTNDFGKKYTERYEVCDLTIESDIIRNGEYSVIARIEHAEQGNIVNVFSGEMKPEWATIPAHCDHCNGNHHQKITLIVSDGKNEKQVGRTCLKDYCGIDPQTIGMINQFMDELDEYTPEGYDFSEHIPVVFDAVKALACAIDAVKEQGYRKSDEIGSNKQLVLDKVAKNDYTEEGYNKAHEMAEVIASMDISEAIDANLNNVQTRIKGFYCKPSDFGYFAYAPVAFERYLERKAEMERRAKQNQVTSEQSNHVGEIGKRIEIDVKEAKLLTSFANYYGTTFLYRFIDTVGNVLVWFASSSLENVEEVSRIKATVKDHTERDGIKQTVLTRVKEISKTSTNFSKSA